jgi:3-isopropylmalate/(R)-2-methylmalate dehydratase large subunit
MRDARKGIVHVIGPEQGSTLPGLTVVCGDSHTSIRGAFACLAFGIGTSEVEHVLALQCLLGRKAKNMLVRFDSALPAGVTAKDMAPALIGQIGTAGATCYAISYASEAVRALSTQGRMTLCNLTVEGGARCGMVAVDDDTVDYLRDRPGISFEVDPLCKYRLINGLDDIGLTLQHAHKVRAYETVRRQQAPWAV